MKFLVRERGFLVSKSEFWVEFGLIGFWFEMIAEFGKIIGLGEHCWAWLSSKRIRLASAFSILTLFVFFFLLICLFCSLLILINLCCLNLLELSQELWRGGLWCCSFTRRTMDHRSMPSSFTSRGGDSLISVCNRFIFVNYLFWICAVDLSFVKEAVIARNKLQMIDYSCRLCFN